MLKAIKTSFKDSVIYGLGNVAVKVVGLLLIPIYTNQKYFSIEQFGVYGLLEISAIVLTAMMASALPQSLTRWYWDKDYIDKQKGIFFMVFVTQLVISLAFCLLLIPLSGVLSQVIFEKTDWSKALSFVILASAVQAINNVVNTLMRIQSRSVLYTVNNLLKLIIVLGLTLYFILSRGMGLEGIYLAQLIGNIFAVVVLSGYIAKNTAVYFKLPVLMSMNSYGFPLLLANLAAAALNVVDRFSLNSITVLKSVALYTLATKITSVLKLVIVDSIKLAVGPMMIKRMDSPDNKRFYSKVMLYTSFVLMFAILGVSVFSYEIVKIIAHSREFWGAVIVIPILSLSIFFINMKEIVVYGLHIVKKTKIIGLIVTLSIAIGLALNIILIPMWDITGAAVATLLSQIIYWYACHYYSQKYFHVDYELKKLGILLFTGILLSSCGLLFNDLSLLPRLLIKAVCVMSFPFLLYLFHFYERAEIQAIKGFYKKWSRPGEFRNNLMSLRNIADDF
jgi:O-antigen/teichoic acid export membrane protein